MTIVLLTIQPKFCGPASLGTVSVIKLVREHSDLGLAQAKNVIDRAVFSGETVELQLDSLQAATSFVNAIGDLPGPAVFHATIHES